MVRALRQRLDGAQRRERLQRAKLQQLETQAAELNQQVKHTKAHAVNLENDANTTETRITALREGMNSARNNKEYAALNVEVSTLKAEKGKVETEALQHLARLEDLTKQSDELKAQVETQRKLVESSTAEVTEARDEVGDRLDATQKERDAAAAEVDDEALALFEKLADEYDGEAVAQAEVQDHKRMEYTCGGCYMSLPAERINTLMSRPDSLTLCTSCGRILEPSDDLKPAEKA